MFFLGLDTNKAASSHDQAPALQWKYGHGDNQQTDDTRLKDLHSSKNMSHTITCKECTS